MLSRLNYEALSTILGERLVLFELSAPSISKFHRVLNALRGNIDGLTDQITREALHLIRSQSVRMVVVDGSNLGGFVAKLKRALPEVEVTTFFHNVETRFFWGSFKATKDLRALFILIIHYLAERNAVRFSDKRICLSERDSRQLRLLYGKGATHIFPMALSDSLTDNFRRVPVMENEMFAIFVGGNFYANREGILWFSQNVAKRISIKVYVIGRGLESMRAQLGIPDRVEVIGSVDDLSEWYRRALFVIAPIFDGSGMKTKVAEALMHGKKVVGTPEAFSGYEDIADTAGWSCSNADEFVTAMHTAQCTIKLPFDPVLREIYEKRYSFSAAKARMAEVFLK